MQDIDKAKSARNAPVIKKIGIDKTKNLAKLNSNLLIKKFYLN